MDIKTLIDRAYDITEDTEAKAIRRVRTPAGARRFGQPIGSIIVRDGLLSNLRMMEPIYEGWERVKGKNGKTYSVGKDGKVWIATEGDDGWDVVAEGKGEEEVLKALDKIAAKGKRTAAKKPAAKKPAGRSSNATSGFNPSDLGPRQRAAYDNLSAKDKATYSRFRRDGVSHAVAIQKLGTSNEPKPKDEAPKPSTRTKQPSALNQFRSVYNELTKDPKRGDKLVVTVPGSDGPVNHVYTYGDDDRWHKGASDRDGKTIDEVFDAIDRLPESKRKGVLVKKGEAKPVPTSSERASSQYPTGTSVSTEWGPGKVVSSTDRSVRIELDEGNGTIGIQRGTPGWRRFVRDNPPAAAPATNRKPAQSIAKIGIVANRPVDMFNFTSERQSKLKSEYDQWIASASEDELKELLRRLKAYAKSGSLTASERGWAKALVDELEKEMR